MNVLTPLQQLRGTRRRRARFNSFAALIGTPGDLTTGFDMPAAGTLYVSTSAALGATTVLLDVGSREIGAPESDANAQHCVGFFEAGVNVKVNAGAPGTVSLFVQGPSGVRHKIAES